MNEQTLKPLTYAREPVLKWSLWKSRVPKHEKKKSVKNKRAYMSGIVKSMFWTDIVLQPWKQCHFCDLTIGLLCASHKLQNTFKIKS